MKIAIGNDHAAGELKDVIMELILSMGHELTDVGAAAGEAVDYPIPGEKVARLVAAGDADLGVLICGTGVGISLAANKVKGIRAAAVSDTATARLIREHNNANVIAIGARIVGSELAKDIIKTFLTTPFSGEERHQRRIDMISAVEENFGK
ncbi:MAG: ribose 5-phosphate isomerase B [Eubacterium sp.]|nr:ribose 5-phosphate isomerase B [Eubacterium sp.]